jgi:hypothetical protein
MHVVVNHDYRFILYSILLCATGLSQGFHTVTQLAITLKNQDNNDKIIARIFIFFIAATAGISIMLVPFFLCLASREFLIIDNDEVSKIDIHYSITTIIVSLTLTPFMCLCVFLMQESNYNYIVATSETQMLSVSQFIKQKGFCALVELLSANFLLYILCAIVCAAGTTTSVYFLTYNAISDAYFDTTCDPKLVMLSFASFLIAKIIAIYGSMKFKLHFLFDEYITTYITWLSALFFMIGFYYIQISFTYSLRGEMIQFLKNDLMIVHQSQGLSSITLIVFVMFVEKVLSYIIFNIAIVPSLTLTIHLNSIKAKEELQIEKFNSEIMLVERKRAFKALSEVIPMGIAQELINGGVVIPKTHPWTIVFFSDIENFTGYCSDNNPMAVFNLINQLFSVMDYCKQLFPCLHKIETGKY